MNQQIVFGLNAQAWNALSLEERKVLLDLHSKALARVNEQQSVAYAFHAASKEARKAANYPYYVN